MCEDKRKNKREDERVLVLKISKASGKKMIVNDSYVSTINDDHDHD